MREIRGRLAVCGALFAFLWVVLSLVSPLRAPADAPPIHVFSCAVWSDPGDAVLEVNFRNDSSATLTSITWRGTYGTGWIDFTLNGKFAPGVIIDHRQIGGYDGRVTQLYQGLNDPSNCRVIATTDAVGNTWRDAAAPGPDAIAPTSPPDDAPSVPASIDNPFRDPVGVVGCWLNVLPGKPTGNGKLTVRFRNLSSKTIDRVVFRAWYGSGGFDFIDGGTFAPMIAQTSNPRKFLGAVTPQLTRTDLPSTVVLAFRSLDSTSSCITVSVHFIDGTTWQNPTTGPTEPPVPTPVPSPNG